VPPEHIAERRTYPTLLDARGSKAPPLLRIQAQNSSPADAFAAVKYRDYWYWIDDRDFRSKGIFTFLTIIMTLAEKEEKVQPPVVTIQGIEGGSFIVICLVRLSLSFITERNQFLKQRPRRA
jgi:hypothetical protein